MCCHSRASFDGWALQVMGWSCDLLLWIAHWVAGWPGAIAALPAMPTAALIVVAIALLWLGMARGRWRWLGAAAMAGAIVSSWMVPRPDVLIAPSGKLVAFRSPDGDLVLSSNRAERLVRDTCLRRNGQVGFRDIGDFDGTETWLQCNGLSCDYAGRVRLSLTEPLDRVSCIGAELAIVGRAMAGDTCEGGGRVIDQADLLARGAHAIYLKDGSLEIIDATSVIGDRPWAPPALSSNDTGADQ